MRKSFLLPILALGVLLGHGPTATAQQINSRPHLDPALQVKVNKTLARTWRERGSLRRGRSSEEASCGNMEIGVFGNSKTAPKEVVIVADSIININNSCRR